MKKDKSVVKSSFISGAFFATLGIVITKILGILYVIPFHSLIGEKGGALYGYAYTIYLFFISISSAGIPLAISKIVAEYYALGNYDAKERAFYLGKKIAFTLGIICFLFLMIFAPFLSKIILKDLTGGNTIEDVTMVIRVISFAILIVPVLSIYRGYFEGHKIIKTPSFSQVIEQLARIIVILVGSFLVVDVFKLGLSTAVGVAVFGATVGAIISYIYLIDKKLKNRSKFNIKASDRRINKISDKEILRKIIYYAFPLIMIDLAKSLYNFIDTFTVISGLVNYANFSVSNAETIMSMLSTWATKFDMIITAISTGIVVSLVPNLTQSIIKKDNKDISIKVNQSIGICLFFTLPMTIGISFLSPTIWNLFYGSSDFGSTLLCYYIFTGLLSSLFTVTITITQVFKDYKCLYISLFVGVLFKMLFNVNLISSFYKMGLPPYYGVITATIFGYLVSIIICFINLGVRRKINFEDLINNVMDIICSSVFMGVILILLKLVIPIDSTSRLINILVIIFYAIVGIVVYFFINYKSKTIKRLFGKRIETYLKRDRS